MLIVKKKSGKVVQAYQLGNTHPMLETLVAQKKIIDLRDGTYEVFSQETVKAESGHGQLAATGDWIRIDGAGYPYPCKDEWFQKNMRHISGDDYEQVPKPLSAWTADMEMCKEVTFLIQNKGLILDDDHPDQYFRAYLWGTWEAAPQDAVLVFYSIEYNEEGTVTNADFNFVVRDEFDRTYEIFYSSPTV